MGISDMSKIKIFHFLLLSYMPEVQTIYLTTPQGLSGNANVLVLVPAQVILITNRC